MARRWSRAKVIWEMSEYLSNVVTVGGAGAESIVTYQGGGPVRNGIQGELRAQGTPGGGAVNQAARLLGAGLDVHLVGPLGDERRGMRIIQLLAGIGQATVHQSTLHGTAGHSFIFINSRDERTTIPTPGSVGPEFDTTCVENTRRAIDDLTTVGAVSIGHLHNETTSGFEKTRAIVQIARDRDHNSENKTVIYLNLRHHQVINTCLCEWRPVLCKADCLQLSFSNARKMVAWSSQVCPTCRTELSLTPMPEEDVHAETVVTAFSVSVQLPVARRHQQPQQPQADVVCPALITIGALGAIAIHPTKMPTIRHIWSREVTNFATGLRAGDAFAAAMIREGLQNIGHKPFMDPNVFFQAAQDATLWAAVACTKFDNRNVPSLVDLTAAASMHREVRGPQDFSPGAHDFNAFMALIDGATR